MCGILCVMVDMVNLSKFLDEACGSSLQFIQRYTMIYLSVSSTWVHFCIVIYLFLL